jgi:V8-like Glu-specific endopeptidase
MITAAHCISENSMNGMRIIFDYQIDPVFKVLNPKIAPENHYSVKKIVSRGYDLFQRLDYAVIELDREVADRPFLNFRESGKIEDTEPLFNIGFPLGVPIKYVPNGVMRKNQHINTFIFSMDLFSATSGSPIFSQEGLVEGIVVRGEKDFEVDIVNNCVRTKVCQEAECLGEDASRITQIPEVINGWIKAQRESY